MEKGKYEMTRIRSYTNGNKDTTRLIVSGPIIFKDQFEFESQVDTMKGRLIIYQPAKNEKKYRFMKIFLYPQSNPNAYQNYDNGKIDSYQIEKKQLLIKYHSQDPFSMERTIQLKWISK